MKSKIQIKSWLGHILFEHEEEDNTIAKTVIKAVKFGANLIGTDLSGVDLSGVDLSGTDFYGTDLTRANLTGVNLSRANLTRANLIGADLTEANLIATNLTRANLTGANLTGANLYGTDLTGANLVGANLTKANLTKANLYGYIYIGPVGSRKSYLCARWEDDKYIVQTGCFRGTLEEFKNKVKETHKSGVHRDEYLLAIKLMELRMKGKK